MRHGLAGLFVLLGALACPPATFAQGGAPAQAPARAASKSEPAVLETPGGKLHGTLELPAAGRAPYPVVLIIAGSGPTDRNGNSAALPGANNSLKYLAEGLAAEGIASLRCDKRGVAESVMAAKSESDLRFDTYIEDAVLWGRKLRGDARFSALVVAGHSEGSLIGMVAARTLGADGFISVAGAGRRIDVVILEQVKPQFTPEQYAKTEAGLKSLLEGKTIPDVPADDILFRPSIQPYIISWLKYDPAKEVARLAVPVLVTQGTHDLQARPEDAKALAAAKPDARLVLVEGMNHVLKMTPADPKQQAASYSDPALPVAPKFLAEVAAFVKGVKKK
ncbi:MAG: alpha/beta hydrolase [Acidobacteria bacterium]|nr:alpha/beta hydrolase [Acidobacteriota bacterium]